jgi:hypothetical protein
MMRSFLLLFLGAFFWSAVTGAILYVIGFFNVEGIFRCIMSTLLINGFFILLVGRRFLRRKLSEYSPLFLLMFPLPIALVLFIVALTVL